MQKITNQTKTKQTMQKHTKPPKQQINFFQGKVISSWRSATGRRSGFGSHPHSGQAAFPCRRQSLCFQVTPITAEDSSLLAICGHSAASRSHFHLWKVKCQLAPNTKKGKTSSTNCFIWKHCWSSMSLNCINAENGDLLLDPLFTLWSHLYCIPTESWTVESKCRWRDRTRIMECSKMSNSGQLCPWLLTDLHLSCQDTFVSPLARCSLVAEGWSQVGSLFH